MFIVRPFARSFFRPSFRSLRLSTIKLVYTFCACLDPLLYPCTKIKTTNKNKRI